MMFCLREIYVIFRVKVVMLEKPSKSEIVVPSGVRFKIMLQNQGTFVAFEFGSTILFCNKQNNIYLWHVKHKK